VYDIK